MFSPKEKEDFLNKVGKYKGRYKVKTDTETLLAKELTKEGYLEPFEFGNNNEYRLTRKGNEFRNRKGYKGVERKKDIKDYKDKVWDVAKLLLAAIFGYLVRLFTE